MWEFYLCISGTAFRRYGHSVFQLQLTKTSNCRESRTSK
jgi:cyclopropane fatty-acyl-phospholipid synthase-like methyltransferase